ncbi:MAG: sulfite exporter TauE/SafE family protein [Bacteroidota bacterium]
MITQFAVFAGLIAAMFHVITGPDHLAAVTPFAIESKKKAWKVGLFWGLGHLFGMIFIGILFILFKDIIPIEKISNYSEQLVGVVLIFIGLWAFYQIFSKNKNHKHLHVHSDQAPVIHTHDHEHSNKNNHQHTHTNSIKKNYFSSFSVGILHGLAGIAHFILFIPVLGFTEKTDAIQYVLGFAIGTVLAMTVYALTIGRIASLANQEHNDDFYKGIRLAGGIFAIIIGVYWVVIN